MRNLGDPYLHQTRLFGAVLTIHSIIANCDNLFIIKNDYAKRNNPL